MLRYLLRDLDKHSDLNADSVVDDAIHSIEGRDKSDTQHPGVIGGGRDRFRSAINLRETPAERAKREWESGGRDNYTQYLDEEIAKLRERVEKRKTASTLAGTTEEDIEELSKQAARMKELAEERVRALAIDREDAPEGKRDGDEGQVSSFLGLSLRFWII